MSIRLKTVSGLFFALCLFSLGCQKLHVSKTPALPIPKETQAISRLLREEANVARLETSPDEIARYIYALSRAYNVDTALILAVIKVESNFNRTATSHKGAMGLMQVMPIVVREVKSDINLAHRTELYDPYKNLHVGVHYFDSLLQKYRGNVMYALTAYNVGPTYLNAIRKEDRELPLTYYKKVMREYYNYQKQLSFAPDTI